jgi:hypothetical protein
LEFLHLSFLLVDDFVLLAHVAQVHGIVLLLLLHADLHVLELLFRNFGVGAGRSLPIYRPFSLESFLGGFELISQPVISLAGLFELE